MVRTKKAKRDKISEENHSKLQKIETAEELPSTKLTDVNNDCLEAVFKHLCINDLLNIAHTSKQLKPAADLAFTSKFGNKTFGLSKGTWTPTAYVETKGEVLKFLRLLRCFGHLISTLEFRRFIFYDQYLQYLGSYISEYCTHSVRNIEFIYRSRLKSQQPRHNEIFRERDYSLYDCITKPLLKVKSLKMLKYSELNVKWLKTRKFQI